MIGLDFNLTGILFNGKKSGMKSLGEYFQIVGVSPSVHPHEVLTEPPRPTF